MQDQHGTAQIAVVMHWSKYTCTPTQETIWVYDLIMMCIPLLAESVT